jgi:hypothetical protein
MLSAMLGASKKDFENADTMLSDFQPPEISVPYKSLSLGYSITAEENK